VRAAALVVALLLAGCAPLGTAPLTGTSTISAPTGAPTSASAATATTSPNEIPGPLVHEHATSAASAPVAAVRAFAAAYINWNAGSVAQVMASLAARSIGQARSAMALAAAQTAGDDELRNGGVANQGTVEAVAPRPGHPGQYVVVTLERTTASASSAYQGLAAAWHVALATVSEVGPRQWVVSGWQPMS